MFSSFLSQREFWDDLLVTPLRQNGRVTDLTDYQDWDFPPRIRNGIQFASTLARILVKRFARVNAPRRVPMHPENADWRQLCEAASKEQDPDKLRAIIAQLIKALDERRPHPNPPQT
jgi:hypothetical protein